MGPTNTYSWQEGVLILLEYLFLSHGMRYTAGNGWKSHIAVAQNDYSGFPKLDNIGGFTSLSAAPYYSAMCNTKQGEGKWKPTALELAVTDWGEVAEGTIHRKRDTAGRRFKDSSLLCPKRTTHKFIGRSFPLHY